MILLCNGTYAPVAPLSMGRGHSAPPFRRSCLQPSTMRKSVIGIIIG